METRRVTSSAVLPAPRRKWVKDALVIGALALVGLALAILTDAWDALTNFVEGHESWELDELILIVLMTGLGGFVFALRRLADLRREVSVREAAEHEVTRLAYTDALTGLANRRSFEMHVAELAEQTPRAYGQFAVLAIDLDNFKNINDVYGHGAGDALLVAIAERLKLLLREGDFAARIGGDEFVVVARSVADNEEAARLARRLSVDAADPVSFADTQLEVGLSVGVAMYPEDSTDPQTLVTRADLALYRAKKDGRGQIRFFEPAMDVVVRERAKLESALRHAIREDAIDVYFQPLVDMDGKQIKGFEALARWTDPELGSVDPQKFIQVAEDAALISGLSDFLLVKACREAATWPANLTLSFNVSPVQLRDRSLGLRIMRILAEEKLLPTRLTLEITESAIVGDFESAKHVLQELRAAGVRIALDDFGTGYSNLAQLTHFPFDTIKIDRSFVSQAPTSSEQATLVRAMMSIGRGLGLETTAEGVETEAQATFLRDVGCRVGQGFLYGKAVSADEARSLIAGAADGTKRA